MNKNTSNVSAFLKHNPFLKYHSNTETAIKVSLLRVRIWREKVFHLVSIS